MSQIAVANGQIEVPFESYFIDREAELRILHERLITSNNPVIITGKGGVGKTALLYIFSKRFKGDFPGGIYRFNGQDADRIRTIIAELSTSPQINRSLLIIDDAELLTSEDLAMFLGDGQRIMNLKLILSTRSLPDEIAGLYRPFVIALQSPNVADIIKNRLKILEYAVVGQKPSFLTEEYLDKLSGSGKTPREALLEISKLTKRYPDEFTISENGTIATAFGTNTLTSGIKIDFFSLLVALLIFILSQVSSQNSEERLAKKIHDVEKTVRSITSIYAPLLSGETYFVNRAVNLRTAPNKRNSKIIEVLSKNTVVKLVRRDHHWKYVKYFDYSIGAEKFGWVYEKYLTKVKVDQAPDKPFNSATRNTEKIQ